MTPLLKTAKTVVAKFSDRDMREFTKEISDLRTLEAVSAYRVQCARENNFASTVLDKTLDPDVKFDPGDQGLSPGRYWCRVARIDLLGTQQAFKEPKPYSLGDNR